MKIDLNYHSDKDYLYLIFNDVECDAADVDNFGIAWYYIEDQNGPIGAVVPSFLEYWVHHLDELSTIVTGRTGFHFDFDQIKDNEIFITTVPEDKTIH